MVAGDSTILTNLRRGALEYCVLAALGPEDRYGLDIARSLGRDGVLMSGEGTLYPLLGRLRRAGYVQTSWRESPTGPPRRYYRLTPDGERAVAEFARLWTPFRDAVDAALSTGGRP
jgi:PadR family transcriptional regulator PadR